MMLDIYLSLQGAPGVAKTTVLRAPGGGLAVIHQTS